MNGLFPEFFKEKTYKYILKTILDNNGEKIDIAYYLVEKNHLNKKNLYHALSETANLNLIALDFFLFYLPELLIDEKFYLSRILFNTEDELKEKFINRVYEKNPAHIQTIMMSLETVKKDYYSITHVLTIDSQLDICKKYKIAYNLSISLDNKENTKKFKI